MSAIAWAAAVALALAAGASGAEAAEEASQEATVEIDDAALAAQLEAVDDFLAATNAGLEAFALRQQGFQHLERGQAELARQACEQALALDLEHGYAEGVASSRDCLGAVAFHVGDYAAAETIYRQRLVEARAQGSDSAIARALNQLATALVFLDRTEDAESIFGEAAERAAAAGEPMLAAEADDGLGLVAFRRGDVVQALERWQGYLAVVTSTPGYALHAGPVLERMARAHAALGDHQAAAAAADSALRIAEHVGVSTALASAYESLGYTQFLAGRLPVAEASLRRAIDHYEAQRAALGRAARDKVSILDYQTIPYELLIQVLDRQGRPGAALEVAERGRARAFAEALAERRGTDAEPPDLARMRAIAADAGVTFVTYALLYEPTSLLIADRFRGVQASLEKTLMIWVLTPGGALTSKAVDVAAFRRRHGGRSVASLVAEARRLVGGGDRGVTRLEPAVAPAVGRSAAAHPLWRTLYDLLIAPIAEPLQAVADRPVVVVPHGPLSLLPFAALRDGVGRALIETHMLGLSPSIAAFEQLAERGGAWPAPDQVLVVGDPRRASAYADLGDLPGAAEEARRVAARFSATPLIGPAATKAKVVERLPGARLVHLASHGLLDVAAGGLPGALVLGAAGDGDGLLTAAEIGALRLPAPLVVLSACDTGGGRVTGDGVLGLGRAFLEAGAAGVVVSLWQVDDAATAELMDFFYGRLGEGEPPAAALREAMLATREDHPHPRSWSAFTIVGGIAGGALNAAPAAPPADPPPG